MGDGVSQWSSIANNFPGPRTELVYNFDSDLAPEEGHAAIRYTNIKSNRGNEGFHNYDFLAKTKKEQLFTKLLMYKRNCRSVPEWVTTS